MNKTEKVCTYGVMIGVFVIVSSMALAVLGGTVRFLIGG